MTDTNQTAPMMSHAESVAFNDGWKRGEAYGRKEAAKELEAVRADRADAYRMVQEANDDVRSLLAERDALQAQLDNMTTEFEAMKSTVNRVFDTEWGVQPGTANPSYTVPHPDEESARNWVELDDRVVKRLVGPWMEVTD